MVSAEPLEPLANRPPTPPIDSDNDVDQAIRLLDTDFTADFDRVSEVPSSPAETPIQPSPPSSRSRVNKRVEFSPCVTAHAPQPFQATSAGAASPFPRRFPSSKQPKPVRSILKATCDLQTPTPDLASPREASDYFSISDPKTFPVMLDSVLKFLDAPSTATRLDGYSTLNGALKAYDDLPDVETMRAKIPLLVKYISRDISESTHKSDPMTSSLATQALKLTTAILMIPALEDALDESFQTLLVDRAIEVLEQDPVPKSIANHHMFLLATQRFSPRVVTATKVERIVASLITIHERVSGNSVVASRLVIFQRLMDQSSSVMLANMRDWMPHVFHGVLSSIKDIRMRAIETGTQAAIMYGSSYQSTKVIIDLFHTATAEGSTYGAYFTARLFDMAKPVEGGENTDLEEAVPQIWSMVVLFFKSKKVKLSQWRLFCEELFLLIQNCLNSKNITVKFRATCAWNRLVYVSNPDREMLDKMEGWDETLRVPFVHILHTNKGRDKKSKEVRHIALAGYCNLLHYALRPSQPWMDLDYFWDAYVHHVLSKLLLSGGRDANLACRVLKALFDGRSAVWDEDMANKAPILPEALSRLDSKWIRSRTGLILNLLGPFFELSFAQPGNGRGIDGTPWRELMTAIARAGSHEVLRSQELKECLAHLMNFFNRLWKNAPAVEENTGTPWISRFTALVECSIEVVGSLPFSEENLSRNNAKTFEAAPTPSNRSSKHPERLHSSAVLLFGLYARPPPTIVQDVTYYYAAKGFLHHICQIRSSRKERLEIIRKCAQETSASGSVLLWKIAVQETTVVLLDPHLNEPVQEPARLGHQARHAISILASGLHHSAGESDDFTPAFELVHVLAKILKQEAGDGGIVLGLMEPLAEALLDQQERSVPKSTLVQFAAKLLQEGTFPRNKQQMDEARRSLWNINLTHSKQNSFEPFNHVYELINSTLRKAYDSLDETMVYLPTFVEATQTFLSKCPLSLFASPSLRKIQHGVSQVVKDDSRLLVGSEDAQKSCLKVLALWQSILDQLRNVPSNKTLLKALDELFASGLNSTHREVINITVSFWNSTFGRLDSLEYPDKVEVAIRRLRPLVELDLPSFPVHHDVSDTSPLRDLIESQSDLTSQSLSRSSKQPPAKRPQRLSALSRAATASPRPEKPTTRRRPSSKAAPKSKLRHNDSQVEFTTVESSSPAAIESQLMTEHQREVKYRQQFETAQRYPEFSSSPGTQRRAPRSGLPSLDFSKQGDVTDTGYATPTLNDGPMDEYITSSPTPKAATKVDALTVENAELGDSASDVNDDDIPSSPPEIADETVYEGTTEMEDLHRVEQEETSGVVPATMLEQDIQHDRAAPLQAPKSVLPANEALVGPAAKSQLKSHPSLLRLRKDVHEEASSDVYLDARSEITNTESNKPQVDIPDVTKADEEQDQDLAMSDDSSPIHFAESNSEQPQGTNESFIDPTTIIDVEDNIAPGDISRVLDSFIKPVTEPDATTFDEEQTPVRPTTQPDAISTRSKRKREEQLETKVSAKRRKSSTSPFKRIMTRTLSFVGLSASQGDDDTNDEDDGGVKDCIVVGSQVDQDSESPSESAQGSPIPESAPASVAPLVTQPSRGKSKKSNTPTISSPISSVRTRASKRRAAMLESEDRQESLIMNSPAPSESRRTTRSQDAMTGQTVDHVMLPPTRRVRRRLDAVVVSPVRSGGSSRTKEMSAVVEQQDSDEQDNHEAAADSQLKHEEEEAAIRQRPIAKPKSVIAQLRNILRDCRTMILGSQEERDLQDVMYEIGKEVFQARKRSRQVLREE